MTSKVKKILDTYNYVKRTNVELYFKYNGESYIIDWIDEMVLQCRSFNGVIAKFKDYDDLMNNLVLFNKPFKSILGCLDFFEAV